MPDKLLFMLSKVQHAVTTHLKKELKKEGIALSPGQMGILLALERDRQTTMGKLSQTVEVDNAAVSRLVDKLEQQNMVERYIDPSDRRQVIIAITREGLDKADIVKKIAQAANDRIKEGFSDREISIYRQVGLAIVEKFK